jgi:hypothetical protein
MRQRLGGCRTLVVCSVDAKAAGGDAILPQDDPHTGDQEVIPGNLGMAEHPRQSGQGIGAEAGTFKACPADGGGHQDGGDTKSPPGPLNGRQAVAWAVLAHGLVDGINKGAAKG